MVSAVTLPAIAGWPYQEIASAFAEHKSGNPTSLRVGYALWALLWKNSDAEQFYVCETIPICLDRTGILEPHEFMFTHERAPDHD
jgi:hypothetical protein